MIEQLQFQEILTTLMRKFDEENKKVTKDVVQQHLGSMELSDSQLDMVMAYIKEKQEEKKLTEKELAYLEEYEEMLSVLRKEEEGERARLIEQLIVGREEAKNRMMELYLPKIVEVAKEAKVPTVVLEDLIQEGNLGLVLGINEWLEIFHRGSLQLSEHRVKDVDKYLLRAVEKRIASYIKENTDYKQKDGEILHRVIELDQSLTHLEKKLGRKVMIDELAEEMKLQEEEVLDILKLAGESLDQ